MNTHSQLYGIVTMALALLCPASEFCPGQILVTGTVTNAAGKPLPHASVEALPRSDDESKGVVGDRLNPWMKTDDGGKFNISLRPGRYKIHAKDEAEGYPDPVFLLNQDPVARFPDVSVGRKNISGVRVVLGAQGGIVDGTVQDAATGAPLARSKVTIKDAANLEVFVEVFTDGKGRFQFTVPAKRLRISASAAGYKSSLYAGGWPVSVSAGEHRVVNLRLPPQ